MIEKPTPTPSYIEIHARRNWNDKECRHKHCAIAHQLEEKKKIMHDNPTTMKKTQEIKLSPKQEKEEKWELK